MSVPMLRIATPRRTESAKTRGFQAKLLTALTANHLWTCEPQGNVLQPVWLSFFGSEQETRAVAANLRGGKAAETEASTFVVPKHKGFKWTSEPAADGVVVTAWLPSVFSLEAGGSPADHVRFLLAPPRWWLDRVSAELAGELGPEARDAARAALFVAYLDRRTEVPLLPDPRFRLKVYRAALKERWASFAHEGPHGSSSFRLQSYLDRGFEEPLGVSVLRFTLEAFLIAQTTQFLDEERRHGSTRIASDRRLLPDSLPPVVQGCLDFGLAAAAG